MILKKEDVLFERDEKGDLIPQTVELGTDAKEEVVITPLLRGEIKRIFNTTVGTETSKDTDQEIILNHCIEPKFTVEEIERTLPYMVNAIVTAILSISGVKEKEKKKAADLKNL